MTLGVWYALLAAFVYGFLGISFEVAGKRGYCIWDFMLAKQTIGFVIGLAVAGFALPGGSVLLLGFIGAITYVAGLSAYLRACRHRDIAANWTIVNLSVILPIAISIIWFQDEVTLLKALGVLASVISVIVIGGGLRSETGSDVRWQWIRDIAIALFFNGWLVALFRFVPQGSEALFTACFYGWSIPLALAAKLLRNRVWNADLRLLGIALLGAATHWSGIMLTMAALVAVGRTSPHAGLVVYPITNGLVIPVGVLLGVFLLKQPVTQRGSLGVACGVAALVLLSL